MSPWGKDAGLFSPRLSLQPSRLFAGLLVLLAAAASAAACASNLPIELKGPLLLLVLACLLRAWQQQSGADALRDVRVVDQDTNTFVLRSADGRECESRYAGYALLGTWVVFMYFSRSGWRRVLGPQRIAVVCDAVEANAFRRLRAWVRLA